MTTNRGLSFSAICDAIESGARLTRRQGVSLFNYALGQRERADRLAQHVADLALAAEINDQNYSRLATDWNTLCRMLVCSSGRSRKRLLPGVDQANN